MSDERYTDQIIGDATAYAFAVRAGYTGTAEQFANDQAHFAENATKVAQDKEAADGYAEDAASSAENAEDRKTEAESWAHGGTGTRAGEDSDNAEYWARQAEAIANLNLMTDQRVGIGKPDGVTATANNGTFTALGVSIQCYVRESGTRFGQDWLSLTPNGTPIYPDTKQIYWVKSNIGEFKDGLFFWDGTKYEPMTKRGGLQIGVEDVSGATVRTSGTSTFLKWSDPGDVVLEGYTIAKWKGTLVVRKEGSAPENRFDGTVVLDSQTRQAYAVNEYEDSLLNYDTTYYYRFFPYTEEYVYTDGSSVSVTPKRIAIAAVPTQSGSLNYTGEVRTPTWSGYDSSQLTIGGTTSATNKGIYTATFTPTADYEWWDGTRTAKDATWEIGKTPLTIPTVSGSYAYDTIQKTAEITGFDSVTMEKTGVEQSANAGTHAVYFNIKDPDNYQWSDGTTTQKTGTWTIAKAKLTPPTVAGSFTYDGTIKTPSISGFDSTTMTKSGEYEAINAGTHTAYFLIQDTDNYEWLDGSTSQKSGSWTIAKATQTITLSSNSVALDSSHNPVTVTATAHTTITGSSSDTTIATVTVSGSTVTITSPDEENGTATITLTAAEGANYLEATETINVTADFVQIYGVEWDGTSSTKWSRTDGAASFTDPVPAVNNGSGSSPFDDISPWKDMVKEERTGGTMVRIPKFYFKWTKTGKTMKLQISMGQEDGFQVAPAFMDRGDGQGERSVVYVARYHCASDYKSKTGTKPTGNFTRAQFRTSIHNLGSDIWQMDYAMLETIWMLYLVEFADWNSQRTIGYGCGNNSDTENMGLTDAMQYHTGTNAASRTTYGHTQYRNIEDLWGNVYDWIDGIYFSSANIYVIKNPADFSDSSGGTLVGTRPTSSNYISAWDFSSASGFTWFLYPSEVSGSESTFVGDYCGYNASGVVLFAGGSYGQVQYHGLFYLYGNYAATYKSANRGSRLQELPSAA